MNRRHIGRASWLSVIVCGLLLISAVGCNQANEPPKTIEGNYVLDRRDLPGGQQLRSPDVLGMMTFKGGFRSFNLFWKEGAGVSSISSISQYWFDENRYTEESVFFMENQSGGPGPKYVTTPERATSPVSKMDASWQFKLPLHGEPDVVFTQNGFTATRAGMFVDHWKKVQ